MATTNTLLRTIKVTERFCRNAPLTGIGGDPTEPGMSIGDWVRNLILAPPFAWRWNRAVAAVTTISGQQDYQVALPNFGWLEKASANNGAGKVFELEVQNNLADDTVQNLPTRIAARLDDDAGNITFRLLPVPDQVYTINIAYQKSSPLFSTVADTWAPLPDYLSYLYNTGFLARAYEYMDDPKAGYTMQLFVKQLVAANAGLTEAQVNIFLGDRIDGARNSAYMSERSRIGLAGQSL